MHEPNDIQTYLMTTYSRTVYTLINHKNADTAVYGAAELQTGEDTYADPCPSLKVATVCK